MAEVSDEEAVAWLRQLARLERDGERSTLALGPFTAFTLIGGLQLATRHPELSDTQRALLTGLIDGLRPWFDGTPGETLIDAGNDPSRDVWGRRGSDARGRAERPGTPRRRSRLPVRDNPAPERIMT